MNWGEGRACRGEGLRYIEKSTTGQAAPLHLPAQPMADAKECFVSIWPSAMHTSKRGWTTGTRRAPEDQGRAAEPQALAVHAVLTHAGACTHIHTQQHTHISVVHHCAHSKFEFTHALARPEWLRQGADKVPPTGQQCKTFASGDGQPTKSQSSLYLGCTRFCLTALSVAGLGTDTRCQDVD